MPTGANLLAAWRDAKMDSPRFYRLERDVVQEFEYMGPQWGHPSNYAMTRFRCAPADELGFISQAHWPAHLRLADCVHLERAIGRAVVDALMSELHPYRGCTVALIGVGWDDVTSSEVAFYRAAKSAMDELRATAEWALVSKHADDPSMPEGTL